MPIFMVPDEVVHFYRAYQIEEGHLVSENHAESIGGSVPLVPIRNVLGTNKNMVITPGHYFDQAMPDTFVKFPSSAQYTPVIYIPQTIGIRVGRIIHRSLGSMVLTGRLFNLLAYIVMVIIAIKVAKRGKWVYVVIALFPVAIQQAASLSADVMTTGLAFITIAYIHSLFFQKDILQSRQRWTLLLLAVLLSLTKQTSIVLLAPLIFLPNGLFKNLKAKLVFVSSVLFFGLLSIVTWYLIIKHQYHNLNTTQNAGIQNVMPVTQLKHIIIHPLSFVAVLFRSFVFEGFKGIPTPDFYWNSMFGTFSWFTYKLPIAFMIMGYSLLLLMLLHKDSESDRNEVWLATIQTGVFVLSVLFIAVALYLAWTPVDVGQVSGIQGRYFIPIIPLLIPVFAVIGRWVRVSFDKPQRAGQLVTVISSVNLVAFLLLSIKWFY